MREGVISVSYITQVPDPIDLFRVFQSRDEAFPSGNPPFSSAFLIRLNRFRDIFLFNPQIGKVQGIEAVFGAFDLQQTGEDLVVEIQVFRRDDEREEWPGNAETDFQDVERVDK